jgi:hypothetical protein
MMRVVVEGKDIYVLRITSGRTSSLEYRGRHPGVTIADHNLTIWMREQLNLSS